MKCIDCQGTGLENENKVCQSCLGFGKIGGDEDEKANPARAIPEKAPKSKSELRRIEAQKVQPKTLAKKVKDLVKPKNKKK